MTRPWHKARSVLIFNRKKILTLIASSVNEAAKIGQWYPGNISKVCNGQLISVGNYYFRYIDPEIEVELSDIGSLQLEAYDKMCEVQRPVYATSKMNRKNWKYNKQSKHEDTNC